MYSSFATQNKELINRFFDPKTDPAVAAQIGTQLNDASNLNFSPSGLIPIEYGFGRQYNTTENHTPEMWRKRVPAIVGGDPRLGIKIQQPNGVSPEDGDAADKLIAQKFTRSQVNSDPDLPSSVKAAFNKKQGGN